MPTPASSPPQPRDTYVPMIITAGGRIRCARCQAMSKRTKNQCRGVAIRGKKTCKFHGGRSTGPRTETGRKNSGAKFLVHGRETRVIRAERGIKMAELQELEALGRAIGLFAGHKTPGPKARLG